MIQVLVTAVEIGKIVYDGYKMTVEFKNQTQVLRQRAKRIRNRR